MRYRKHYTGGAISEWVETTAEVEEMILRHMAEECTDGKHHREAVRKKVPGRGTITVAYRMIQTIEIFEPGS